MSSRSSPSIRTILVSVVGFSPAVLTETVWALAQETSAVIPDEVVVVTTTQGGASLRNELLCTPGEGDGLSVWQALRKCVLGKNYKKDLRLSLAPLRIIALPDGNEGVARELDDIRTAEDSAAAAECIFAAVRQFTSDPDTRVIGLLAGGRKTMGALLHAAVSLSGRKHDRLVHVLVNPPFDHPALVPRFYFFGQPGVANHRSSDGKLYPNNQARIELADVPVVALGELISAHTGQIPATFAALARAADTAVSSAREAHALITVQYREEPSPSLEINGRRIRLSRGRCSRLAQVLCQRALDQKDNLRNDDLFQTLKETNAGFLGADIRGSFAAEDVNKALSELRSAVAEVLGDSTAQRIFPLRSPVGLKRDFIRVTR